MKKNITQFITEKSNLKLLHCLHIQILHLPGSKCPTGAMTAHTVCPSGEYQSSTGQQSCLACTAGNECSDPTTAPQQCNAGTYAPANSVACTPCAAGRHSSS